MWNMLASHLKGDAHVLAYLPDIMSMRDDPSELVRFRVALCMDSALDSQTGDDEKASSLRQLLDLASSGESSGIRSHALSAMGRAIGNDPSNAAVRSFLPKLMAYLDEDDPEIKSAVLDSWWTVTAADPTNQETLSYLPKVAEYFTHPSLLLAGPAMMGFEAAYKANPSDPTVRRYYNAYLEVLKKHAK